MADGRCPSCGHPYTVTGRLAFRAICEACEKDLHSCLGCQFYKPGLPNDCMVPDTDPITDRARYNFCDEFAPANKPPPDSADPSAAAKQLFGDEEPPPSKSNFDDLFK